MKKINKKIEVNFKFNIRIFLMFYSKIDYARSRSLQKTETEKPKKQQSHKNQTIEKKL